MQIDFDVRFDNWEHRVPSCSIDGTDFLVKEKGVMDRQDYSHKFSHSALRYEVCLSLGPNTRILWIAGGVPAGAWPDLALARERFRHVLPRNERALADKGYRDERYFLYPKYALSPQDIEFNRHHKRIMARHEAINARFKVFGALRTLFRHNRAFHRTCTFAIANIVNCNLIDNPDSFPSWPLRH